MSMTALVAGAGLSSAEEAALDEMTALKKKAREKGEVRATNPLLDRLIQQEGIAAREWVSAAQKEGDRSALWQDANQLHMQYSRLAGE